MTGHSATELARLVGRIPSSTIRDLLAVTERPGMRSLAGGFPDPATFPRERLAAAAATVLGSDANGAAALQYGQTDGIRSLRELLAGTRALHGLPPSDPDTFVVTSGSQQAIDLLGRALVDPGQPVIVDDPCYLGARQALLATGAELIGLPVDDDGLCVDIVQQRLRAGLRPRVLYTVANFQNPTGAVLSRERRYALVELAQHYGFVVIEDDPYYALDFDVADRVDRSPIGALDDTLVVSLGTCSKILAPGLRVGWLRAPAWLRDALVRVKQACDLHTSPLAQAIAEDVLADEPFLYGHLVALRAAYAAKARALAAALDGWTEGPTVRGGMFLWRRIAGVDSDALLAAALAEGVAFVPGGAFSTEPRWAEYLRLSFATLDIEALRSAAATLRELADRHQLTAAASR